MGNKQILNNYGSFDVTFVKGQGSILTDVNGKKYVDFLAGIAVNCLGHNYKPLVKAVAKQAKKQIHICNYFTSDIGNEYAAKLLKATGFEGVFFGNSGAEANECAIKLARKYGWLNGGEKRRTIITLKKSFHGRPLTTLTATGQEKFHPECFGPYVEGFKYLEPNDWDGLKTAFDDTVAAVMFEPVQCEGGVLPLDKEWAKACAKAARDAGAIVICDEVQTGMGRCGSLLCSDLYGVEPEVVTLAKAIAGGIPMGACMWRGKGNVFTAGDHQSTFGGNPLACAGANVVLDELTKPGFMDAVNEKGNYIRETIKSWNLPCVVEVRGMGLVIGVQVKSNPLEYEKACLAKGLLFSTAGDDVLRFVPPLNISKKEIEAGLAILKEVLSA
ncbi:acetylornithine/succinylornithine family transaminase [Treponema sp.]|uniref:aspartate aminotransferase family protein n=1 Tax=Treponema sp. TaxID=166 RepID=UPI001E143F64|nr:acetylornithine/succinylornithine family transaminase [Treponema sp.]MBS7241702.1 acetylornithine/succinylornithine family transaminase [Treponema sp.]MCI6442690.1 acetylornithine/succinylornithine family transaminase [Spirochaetia bacterium]MDY4132169.1 acetylornithine/succinylornithine family transaminase [Treponema sp.]